MEAPTIISANTSGIVVVRCLNVDVDGTILLPESCFTLNTRNDAGFPIGRRAYQWQSKVDDGNHSEYTYDLSPIFPRISPGARGALTFHYCLRETAPVTVQESPADARSDPYDSAPWVDTGNIFTPDGNYATSAIVARSTDNIVAYGFAFTIPAPATIKGIQVDLLRRDTLTSTLQTYVSIWNAAHTKSGGHYSPIHWPAVEAYESFGGPADTWDAGMLPGDLNDPNFEVWIRAESGYVPTLSQIDYVRLSVTYSVTLDQFTTPYIVPFPWE